MFTQIYDILIEPDPVKKKHISLVYMGILFGFACLVTIVNITVNFCFSLAGSRLTKKLRILMFDSMMRQEIGIHDLPENSSSILSTKLECFLMQKSHL